MFVCGLCWEYEDLYLCMEYVELYKSFLLQPLEAAGFIVISAVKPVDARANVLDSPSRGQAVRIYDH